MRLVIVASIMAIIAAPAAGADAQIESTVARHVGAIVPPDGAGGVAVALRFEGRTRFFNYGWADRADKRLITSDTLFNLASLRKVFRRRCWPKRSATGSSGSTSQLPNM